MRSVFLPAVLLFGLIGCGCEKQGPAESAEQTPVPSAAAPSSIDAEHTAQGNEAGEPVNGTSNSATPPDSTATPVQPAPAGTLTIEPPAGLDPNWSPPYYLHFAGYTYSNLVYGVGVNDTGVYWTGLHGLTWRANLLNDGQPAALLRLCDGCQPNFVVGKESSYHLRVGNLVQISLPDGVETLHSTPIQHSGSSPIALDENYVYAASRGCTSIARYARSDMTAEVMAVPEATGSGTGRTVLRVDEDARFLCANPMQVIAIDEWGGAARVVKDSLVGLRSMDASDDKVYWVTQTSTITDPPSVGFVDQSGGGVQSVASPVVGGDLTSGCLVPGTEKFLVPQGTTLEVFDGDKGSFVTPIELDGRPLALTCGPDAVYAGVSGDHDRGPRFSLADSITNWIAKVPYDAFE
jgi:hypothetical protein